MPECTNHAANVNSLLTLHIGPQFGILLNNEKSLWASTQEAVFTSNDFAMVIGAQVNVARFRAFGRYNIGLTNIKDVPNSDIWKSQQIQLGIGVRLL